MEMPNYVMETTKMVINRTIKIKMVIGKMDITRMDIIKMVMIKMDAAFKYCHTLQ